LKEASGDFHAFNLLTVAGVRPESDQRMVYPITKHSGDGLVWTQAIKTRDSPAAKAGLKAGDIIVEVGGKAVKNNLDLIKALNDKKDGDVMVIIVRDRNRQTVTVTPEPSKDNGFFFHTEKDDGL
jgi:membrane-associated protease RseP (regulator of RpoE activity)